MSTVHLFLGYLVVIAAAVGFLWNGYGYVQGRSVGARERTFNTWFLAALYLQVLLGLLSFMLSSGALPSALHPFVGIAALAVAQWGLRPRMLAEGRGPGFQALIYLGAGVLAGLGIVL